MLKPKFLQYVTAADSIYSAGMTGIFNVASGDALQMYMDGLHSISGWTKADEKAVRGGELKVGLDSLAAIDHDTVRIAGEYESATAYAQQIHGNVFTTKINLLVAALIGTNLNRGDVTATDSHYEDLLDWMDSNWPCIVHPVVASDIFRRVLTQTEKSGKYNCLDRKRLYEYKNICISDCLLYNWQRRLTKTIKLFIINSPLLQIDKTSNRYYVIRLNKRSAIIREGKRVFELEPRVEMTSISLRLKMKTDIYIHLSDGLWIGKDKPSTQAIATPSNWSLAATSLWPGGIKRYHAPNE